ncbi:MAG TPA: DNA ligase D [Verrucomicrobiae bacterium]|nr:DNA ligase D [Verrucomicrobiae bacterium]
MAGLAAYRRKRSFGRTPEPRGSLVREEGWHFVIHKHAASHLHYDFRLEFEGVLKSWAVPKGPPMRVGDKRLAIQVEDHPLAYRTFHGRIPAGQYGAGTVEIWDHGTYEALEDMKAGLKSGSLKIRLHGKKLKADFALVRMNNPKYKNGWLLIREKPKAPLPAAILAKDPPGKLPATIRPMLAQMADEPFNRPGWLFETKWDGYRLIARLSHGKVKLQSRNGLPYTQKFPALVADLARLPVTAVIDGEVVVLDRKGRAGFQRLQEYFKTGQGNACYEVFDLLEFNGHDLRGLPLRDRKRLLKQLVTGLKHIKYTEHVETNGKSFFKRAVKAGAEGVMAKRADSPYLLGERSADWLKIKSQPRQEAVVVGYTEPRGRRKFLGALVLGVYEGGMLRYIGHTGGGSNEEMLANLYERLKKMKRAHSSFAVAPKTNAPVHWVEPKLVVEVKFREWTDDGIMRQPILLGIRTDKAAKLVVRESAAPQDLTHAEKLFWPKEGIRKGDLARYYDRVAPVLLPYLRNRPLVLDRYPNGIEGESFFQKDQPNAPKGIKTVAIRSASEGKTLHYLVCNDRKTLDYAIQLGGIVLHPWLSNLARLERPDFLVIDLDPESVPFDHVVKTALVVKDVLDEIGAASYCKTSGSRGLHVCVPLGGTYSYEQSLLFAQLVAAIAHQRLPRITSLERNPAKRQHKVYLDCFQNRKGATLVAPYSVRPNPGAPVSTPLDWKEVKPGLDPRRFTIFTMPARLAKRGDLWKPVFGKGIRLNDCLARLKRMSEKES